MKRMAERSKRSGGRATLLCSLSTVQVKKGEQGFQIIISGAERNWKAMIGSEKAAVKFVALSMLAAHTSGSSVPARHIWYWRLAARRNLLRRHIRPDSG